MRAGPIEFVRYSMSTSTEFVHGWDKPWKNCIETWRKVVSTHAFTHSWHIDQLERAHVLILSCVSISRSPLNMLINAETPSRGNRFARATSFSVTRWSAGNHFCPRHNRFVLPKSMRENERVMESDESNTWWKKISAERVQKRQYPARKENVMKTKFDRSTD